MKKTTKMNERKKKPADRKGLVSEGNIGTGGNLNQSKTGSKGRK